MRLRVDVMQLGLGPLEVVHFDLVQVVGVVHNVLVLEEVFVQTDRVEAPLSRVH